MESARTFIATGTDGIRRYQRGPDAGRWANIRQALTEAIDINDHWDRYHWAKKGDRCPCVKAGHPSISPSPIR